MDFSIFKNHVESISKVFCNDIGEEFDFIDLDIPPTLTPIDKLQYTTTTSRHRKMFVGVALVLELFKILAIISYQSDGISRPNSEE